MKLHYHPYFRSKRGKTNTYGDYIQIKIKSATLFYSLENTIKGIANDRKLKTQNHVKGNSYKIDLDFQYIVCTKLTTAIT